MTTRPTAPRPTARASMWPILMSDLIFPDDVAAAFNHEKFTAITGKPAPTVTTVTVDGGGVYNGNGSFEASLDVQQVLGGAPGANVTLVSIPDLSNDKHRGWLHVYRRHQHVRHCQLVLWRLRARVLRRPITQGTDFTYVLQQLHEIFRREMPRASPSWPVRVTRGPGVPERRLRLPGAHQSTSFGPGISSPSDDPDVTAVGGGNLSPTSDRPSSTPPM